MFQKLKKPIVYLLTAVMVVPAYLWTSFAAAPLAHAAGAVTLSMWGFDAENLTPEIDVAGGADISFNTGSSADYSAGNPGQALSLKNWHTGEYIQVDTDTSGYSDISIQFDLRRLSQGPATYKLQYTSNGSDYTDFVTGQTITDSSFNTDSHDLSALTAIDDNEDFSFRITSEADAINVNGTLKIDNLRITGVLSNTAPGTPILLAPDDESAMEATGNPVALLWLASTDDDGDTLEYQIEHNSNLYTSSGTSQEVPEAVGVNHWKVRAYDGNEFSDWSEERSFTITDSTSPYLLNVGFTSQHMSELPLPLPADEDSVFYLKTNGEGDDEYHIRFSDEAESNEPLESEYAPLFLISTDIELELLESYYDSRLSLPTEYRNYLKAALEGDQPFAYVKTGSDKELELIDAARHDIGGHDVPMSIPGDYPEATFEVAGEIHDLNGNKGEISFGLTIDRTPPAISLLGSNPLMLKINSEFVDPGIESDDPNFKYSLESDLDLSTLGEYILTYTAVDIAGNQSQISRTVIVVQPLLSPEITVTKDDKTITVSWDGVAGATGYYVYIGTVAGEGYVYKSEIIPAETQIFHSTLGNYGTFYIRVTAIDQYGLESDEIDSVLKQKSISLIAPPAPVVTTASVVSVESLDNVENDNTNLELLVQNDQAPLTSTPSDDQGQIKGDESAVNTEEDAGVNWTPWIILFILIILAGAATGGYFYWFAGEDDIETKTVEENKKAKSKVSVSQAKPAKKGSAKEGNSKKSKRW